MEQRYQPPAGYSTAQLLERARALGYSKPRRLLTDWQTHGLMGAPTVSGQGRGKGVLGWWSQRQYALWEALLLQRKRQTSLVPLYNIPVWGWLFWGQESGVSLAQVRRVMRHWCDAVRFSRSAEAARRTARETVGLAAHPRTRAKREVIDALSQMATSGQYPDEAQLRYLFALIVDPEGTGASRGPVGASLTPETLAGLLTARHLAVEHLKNIPDPLWEWARTVLIWSLVSYQEDQPRFATDPNIGQIFTRIDLTMLVSRACEDLLTMLGTSQLILQKGWISRFPEPFDPRLWQAGEMSVTFRPSVTFSPVLLPNGQRQPYLQGEFQVTRASTPGKCRAKICLCSLIRRPKNSAFACFVQDTAGAGSTKRGGALEGKQTFSRVTQDYSGVTEEILDQGCGLFLELRKSPDFLQSYTGSADSGNVWPFLRKCLAVLSGLEESLG